MTTDHSPKSHILDQEPGDPYRASLASSMRFWETRRLVYNAILFVVVLVWLVATWPHFRGALTLANLGRMIVLALLANLCYCAAYLVEIPMQMSPLRESWNRVRVALWVMGTVFAFFLTNYWIADEIYPYVD